ncbi:unnamed protein product [Closterium sp. Yama58-4]|nr:unnamed protein product [Closterium sp. Yama58-4]
MCGNEECMSGDLCLRGDDNIPQCINFDWNRVSPNDCSNTGCLANGFCFMNKDNQPECACNEGLVPSDSEMACVPPDLNIPPPTENPTPSCNKVCPSDAQCIVISDNTFSCQCTANGFTFSEADQQCHDQNTSPTNPTPTPSCNKVCPSDAKCIVLAEDTFSCQCNTDGFTFSEADQQCHALSAGPATPTAPSAEPATPTETATPTAPSAEPATPTETATPAAPSAEPATPTAPSAEPATPTAPSAEPATPTAPSAEPATPTAPSAEPATPTAPSAEPATPTETATPAAPSAEPATPTAPSAEPATPTAPSAEPATPTAPCSKDCGSAKCVVEEGKAQCKCPLGLVFNEAEKTCSNAYYTPAADPCKAGTVKCGKNSKCVVRDGKACCECDAGYTKRNGHCTGEFI